MRLSEEDTSSSWSVGETAGTEDGPLEGGTLDEVAVGFELPAVEESAKESRSS